MEKQVSVIIQNWNTFKFTKKCIETIEKHTDPNLYEFILIDKGSKDGSLEYLKTVKNARLFELVGKDGYAAGMNVGLQENKFPYVCMVNSDIEIISDKWLNLLLEDAQNKHLGIISPLVRMTPSGKIPRPAVGGCKFTPAVIWLMRKEIIDRIGLFDERFGYGLMEDTDYCDRIKDAKLGIYVDGRVIIEHWEHQTFYANNIDYNAQNKIARNIYMAKRLEILKGKQKA